jgi:hypothetical protein
MALSYREMLGIFGDKLYVLHGLLSRRVGLFWE